MPPPIIKHNRSAFLEYRLQAIWDNYNASVKDKQKLLPEWPAQSDTKALVDIVIPLFIFAATACRFISESWCSNPDVQLKKVLEYRSTSTNSRLKAIYIPILDQQIISLSLQEKDEVIRRFQMIVGTIIILVSPLLILAIAELLKIP
jgi:hypothetical protein